MADKQEFWRVVVTYGTKGEQTFARVPSRESAEALRRLAIAKKYYDARVEKDEGAEPENQEARGRGPAHQKRTARAVP